VKKVVAIIVIVILMLITACSNKEVIKHNYTYRGENEFWLAEYKVNGTGIFTEKNDKTEYESNSEKILTVSYKKDLSELSAVRHLQIFYESSASGGETNTYFDDSPDEKTYTINSSGEGGAIENKDEIITVRISLDDNMQTIELRNIE